MAKKDFPKLVSLSQNLILLQCSASAFNPIQLGCGVFEPRHPNCFMQNSNNKYTLTHVDECTIPLQILFQYSRDPFEPHHGSFRAEGFGEQMTLKMYKDSTEREEL